MSHLERLSNAHAISYVCLMENPKLQFDNPVGMFKIDTKI